MAIVALLLSSDPTTIVRAFGPCECLRGPFAGDERGLSAVGAASERGPAAELDSGPIKAERRSLPNASRSRSSLRSMGSHPSVRAQRGAAGELAGRLSGHGYLEPREGRAGDESPTALPASECSAPRDDLTA